MITSKALSFASEEGADRFVTITVRRSTLSAALGLLLGFALGVLAAKSMYLESASESEPVAAQNSASNLAVALESAPRVPIQVDGRPSFGPADAPVTIVEFLDYKCPYCARHFRETLPLLHGQYRDSIRYVVLNFPLSNIHPLAQKAAEAAECAHDQGKFWEYHDALFLNQSALDTASLKGYARDLGLDEEVFSHCLETGAKSPLVLQDLQTGRRHGASGTPTFFVNGEKIVGAQAFEQFRVVIDGALDG